MYVIFNQKRAMTEIRIIKISWNEGATFSETAMGAKSMARFRQNYNGKSKILAGGFLEINTVFTSLKRPK